jgi:hypothetical protein
MRIVLCMYDQQKLRGSAYGQGERNSDDFKKINKTHFKMRVGTNGLTCHTAGQCSRSVNKGSCPTIKLTALLCILYIPGKVRPSEHSFPYKAIQSMRLPYSVLCPHENSLHLALHGLAPLLHFPLYGRAAVETGVMDYQKITMGQLSNCHRRLTRIRFVPMERADENFLIFLN